MTPMTDDFAAVRNVTYRGVGSMEEWDEADAALARIEDEMAALVAHRDSLVARLTDTERANDELRQEAERLRSDAAYGRTAMDSYAVVQRERDRLREVLQELVDEQWPCDTDNLHVEVWCIAHQTKRCHMDEIVARARAALAASPTMTPPSESEIFTNCLKCGRPIDSPGASWCNEHASPTTTPQEDFDE